MKVNTCFQSVDADSCSVEGKFNMSGSFYLLSYMDRSVNCKWVVDVD